MKFNKWTLGLAAIGVVSLASAAKAEEKNALQTALSGTTFSGYVDTSAQWNFGSGNWNLPDYKFGGERKADGFNLNVVQLTLSKPLDESEWASGYHLDLWFGPDANRSGFGLGTTSGWSSSSDFAIRQAYVELRAPTGNGIDLKMGVFDSIIGYESVEAGNNPNFTRSYGHSMEPQTHTGLLASYRFNDNISVKAGVADTVGPRINERAFISGDKAESFKTYMASFALTAPDDWGFLSGSTLYGGVVNGFSSSYDENQTSWYAGATLATPVAGLRVGASFDALDIHHQSGETWSIAGYASYQATEKLSLHARGEYLRDRGNQKFFYSPERVIAATATAQYDLWKNVISRAEIRWDHSADGDGAYGRYGDLKNAFMLAANIIYKF